MKMSEAIRGAIAINVAGKTHVTPCYMLRDEAIYHERPRYYGGDASALITREPCRYV